MSPSLPCHVTPYCSALPPIVLYRLHSVTPSCNVSLAPYLTPYCTVSCAPYVSYHRVDELSSIFMLRRYFYFFTMRLLLLFLHCAIVTFISSLCDCHFYFFTVRLSRSDSLLRAQSLSSGCLSKTCVCLFLFQDFFQNVFGCGLGAQSKAFHGTLAGFCFV